MIASQCLFSVIDVFEVHDPNILSDHCILQFSVTLHDIVSNAESEISPDSSLKYKYVWNSNEVESYQNALQSDDVQGALNDLKTSISNMGSADDLNLNVKSFQEIIDSVCKPLFKKSISKSNINKCSIFNEINQPWFNENFPAKKRIVF